jgi:tagaturonate epimerase
MNIQRYTFGMGDRFAHQGIPQLRAVVAAQEKHIPIYPAWNKSNREHRIIGSSPDALREEADAAVQALQWRGDYYVDADHINLNTVEGFITGSNFFTLDVAEQVGRPPASDERSAFMKAATSYTGELSIPGIAAPFEVDEDLLTRTANQYLAAACEAGRIYRFIAERKGADTFVTEVSIDETDRPQTPVELFLILIMLAQAGVPAQTIAPKFTGRFNKGVDYVGDLVQFEKEFDEDLHVLRFAVEQLGFPATLKLSVHSGSDKFSLYPIINKLIRRHDCGLHVKTAGTTWLEEVIGLAEAGGDGLAMAKKIYVGAHAQYEELTAPYATVIDIDPFKLPAPKDVAGWSSDAFVAALRHEPDHPAYNPHFRQLIHVGFKVAAKQGSAFTDALEAHRPIIARNVTHNLLNRHMLPIFANT